MYNQPVLPIISENQRNLLISLAYTVSQQKLANVAKLVTQATNPRSASECFEIDPIITLLHEANAARDLIKAVNAVAASGPDAFYPIAVQVNWIAVNIILKALNDTDRIVNAFKAVGDPTPEIWWYKRLEVYVSERNLTDLYILIGSLRAIVAPFTPINSDQRIQSYIDDELASH